MEKVKKKEQATIVEMFVLLQAKKGEANVMKRILDRYAVMSGQVINFNKSAITFSSNTTTTDRVEVCEQLQVQEKETPGKYLGIPMHIGRNKKSVFSCLIDKVEQKLQAWSAQNISKAGKVILLKTSAQSVPNFWMNLLLLPTDICTMLEKRMNSYWWRGGNYQKGIRWTAWDRLCESKEGVDWDLGD
ncbi:uncharacterized protein LOC141673664 [Apium graveolens]|uniref:uncharacterized protein LOC141673664 n=1 Tax=Apium graveolens TaxID=4045 RepID=UPI003D7C10F9